MDLFQYFEEEHKYIEERLSELEKSYQNWSSERVFVRVTKLFEAIANHFDKQESLLLNELKQITDLSAIINECTRDREKILADIDDLVMDHIDSSEFHDKLSNLLKDIRKHISFSDAKLYKEIKTHISQEKLAKLNDLIKEKIFS